MRALLFSSGVAVVVVLLLLAGCEEVMDKPSPAPMTDTAPSFSNTVADQAYLMEEIVSLTLPHATGGDGPLTYSLAPEIPGLMFDATTRTLSGAPTAADAYDMTYQAADADDNTAANDAATLTFTITVQDPEPLDTAPAFAATVADHTYTEGDAISPLTLPEASGGNGALSYSLMPAVPGLMFDATTRTLSGAPTMAGTHAMTYTVVDGDENTEESDSASQRFTVTVLAACPTHSVTQIVGDYIVAHGSFFPSGWVFSFRADGTFQINSGAVTINGESEGNYSYDVTTCTLAWRGTEPAAEPSIGITIIGHLGFVAIRGTNEHFVDWNGSDQFSTKFSPGGFVLTTFDRR